MSVTNIYMQFQFVSEYIQKRFLFTAGADFGFLSGEVGVHVDDDGGWSAEASGSVNVDGVEAGASGSIDDDGGWELGGSLGVGVGPFGGADVHGSIGSDGAEVGVGAHIDAGPFHASGEANVNEDGEFSTDT